MEKKQTAVEWLQEQFHKVPFSQFGNLIQQAKQMEREQIEECGDKCQILLDVDFDGNVTFMYKGGSDYFTKTYGDEVVSNSIEPLCFCGKKLEMKCGDNRVWRECENGHEE